MDKIYINNVPHPSRLMRVCIWIHVRNKTHPVFQTISVQHTPKERWARIKPHLASMNLPNTTAEEIYKLAEEMDAQDQVEEEMLGD